jgi:hypothetical protein
MAESIYLLCAATSIASAWLLLAAFRKTGARLLFWSGLCFVGLALNNILLFIDLSVIPSVDLRVWRSALALLSMAALIFGLVWESR